MGLRDPFLIRSPEGDRFFLIATDLSIGRNGDWDAAQRQGSQYLEVWESTDLVNWSRAAARDGLAATPPATPGRPRRTGTSRSSSTSCSGPRSSTPRTTRATPANTYNRMLYATTRDFVTFSEPKIWQDRGESRIDSTVIREDGTYYRFTKDEGGGGTGCSDIIQEKSDSLTRGRPARQPGVGVPWTPASAATPAPPPSRARRSSRPTRATPPARTTTTSSSTSTAAAATSRSAPPTSRARLEVAADVRPAVRARATAPSSR